MPFAVLVAISKRSARAATLRLFRPQAGTIGSRCEGDIPPPQARTAIDQSLDQQAMRYGGVLKRKRAEIQENNRMSHPRPSGLRKPVKWDGFQAIVQQLSQAPAVMLRNDHSRGKSALLSIHRRAILSLSNSAPRAVHLAAHLVDDAAFFLALLRTRRVLLPAACGLSLDFTLWLTAVIPMRENALR